MIRGEKTPCPFGLEIPKACLTIGNEVLLMEKSEPSSTPIVQTQSIPGCNTCPYARAVHLKTGVVDCSYKEQPKDVTIGGSPFYPSIYLGIQQQPSSMNYLSSYYDDSSFYDNNLHNGYLGLFSLYGNH